MSLPKDVAAVYRNSHSLVFDGFVDHMLAAIGLTASGLESTLAKPSYSDDENMDSNSLRKKAVKKATNSTWANLPPRHARAIPVKLMKSFRCARAWAGVGRN